VSGLDVVGRGIAAVTSGTAQCLGVNAVAVLRFDAGMTGAARFLHLGGARGNRQQGSQQGNGTEAFCRSRIVAAYCARFLCRSKEGVRERLKCGAGTLPLAPSLVRRGGGVRRRNSDTEPQGAHGLSPVSLCGQQRPGGDGKDTDGPLNHQPRHRRSTVAVQDGDEKDEHGTNDDGAGCKPTGESAQ